MKTREEWLDAIAAAEEHITYNHVFRQETGEEAVVSGMTLEEAIERYPEWSFRYGEMVRDSAYHDWKTLVEEYEFWNITKDMTAEEYDEYVDSLDFEYEDEFYD